MVKEKSCKTKGTSRKTYANVRKVIVECPLNQVSISDIALSAWLLSLKWVWYRNIAGKNMLITGSAEKKNSILGDGTFISYVVATEVFFAEVDEKNEFLIFDPLSREVEYTNDQNKANEPNAKSFLVIDLPDELVDEIVKEIGNELKKGKKRNSA